MENRYIWFKGDIIPADKAKVNVLSPTSQFGLNVFEGIRCYWNDQQEQLYAFRLIEHFDRLFDSCKLIGINNPYSTQQLFNYLQETIHANQYRQDIAVRMTVFVDGEGSWNSVEPIEMFIAPIKKNRANPESIEGLSACVSTWERINDRCLPPRIKTGANYINGRYGHLEARRNGYDLPVFLGQDGKVSEGAGACLFIVRHGKLITPTITSSILESITRLTILELAIEMNLTIIERNIDRTELYLADEVFLCGSTAEITPITSVDKVAVGSGEVGVIATLLLQKYLHVASNNEEKYTHWTTPIYS